jgi:hypothetical protein
VWRGGLAPPLIRGLSAGVELRSDGLVAGLTRAAPRPGLAEPADWAGRVGLDARGLSLWGEFRGHPWRGGLGLAAERGALRVAAQVDAHPVLDPTLRVSVGLAHRAGER